MKKSLLCLLFGMIASIWAMADVVHIVDRGETLKSIAQKYGVTEAQIIELNPDAAQFVYVGMELTIPSSGMVNKQESGPQQETGEHERPGQQQSDLSDKGYEEESKLGFIYEITYGFLKSHDVKVDHNRSKSNNYTYGLKVLATYQFYKSAYAGAGLGYNSSNYQNFNSTLGAYANSTTTYHFVTIPVELGYKFGDKFNLIPYAGFNFDICVASKTKYKANDHGAIQEGSGKNKKPFCVDFNAGIRLNFSGFGLVGGYHIPINKKAEYAFGKDGYFTVGICCVM